MSKEHRITFDCDDDAIFLTLPGNREVTIYLNDIESDALPQLEIILPVPMTANCWLPDTTPAVPLKGTTNALLSTHIAIPIEPISSITKARIAELRAELEAERIDLVELAEIETAFAQLPDGALSDGVFINDNRENATAFDMLNELEGWAE